MRLAASTIGMEPLLQLTQNVCGKSVVRRLLSIFRLGRPNSYHRFFTWLVSEGYCKRIITTNFDSLLEKADPAIRHKVIHLHGTVSESDALATLLQVGKGLPRNSQNVLLNDMRAYSLLFVGWRDDDLDITPTLFRRAKPFIVVSHSVKGRQAELSAPNPYPSPDLAVFRRTVALHGGLWISANSNDFFRMVSNRLGCEGDFEDEPLAADQRTYVANQINEVVRSIPRLHQSLLASDVLWFVGAKDAALSALDGITDRGGGEYRYRKARILSELSKYHDAEAVCDLIIKTSRGRLRADAFSLLGAVRAREANDRAGSGQQVSEDEIAEILEPLNKAREMFQAAKRGQREFGLLKVYGNIALAYLLKGNLPKAARLFTRHQQLARELGELHSEMITCVNLADLHLRHRQPAAAIRAGKRGVELANILGDRKARGFGHWNLAAALEQTGARASALLHYQNAARDLEKLERTGEIRTALRILRDKIRDLRGTS